MFASDQEVALLMKAVRRLKVDNFSWIGSDGWSERALVSRGESFCLPNKNI